MGNLSREAHRRLIEQMRADFTLVCAYFQLSADARRVAWSSALGRILSAAPCYRAIASSLATPDVPPGSKRRRERGMLETYRTRIDA